jgi:hypothetical protein
MSSIFSTVGSKLGLTPKQQNTITAGEMAQQNNAPQIEQDIKRRNMFGRVASGVSGAVSRVASGISGAASGAATLAAKGSVATTAVAKRHQNPNDPFLITGSVRDTENAFSGAHWAVQGTATALAGTTAAMAGILNMAGLSSVTKGIAEVALRSSKVVGAVLGENRINKVEANKIYAFLTENGFISKSYTTQEFQSLMDVNIGLSGLMKYLYELAVVYVELKREKKLGIVVDIKEAEAELTKQINNLEQQIKTLIEVSPTENGVKLPDFENYTTYGDIEVYKMMPATAPSNYEMDMREKSGMSRHYFDPSLKGGYKRKTHKGKKGKGKKATKRHHYKKTKRSKSKHTKRKTKRRHNKRK